MLLRHTLRTAALLLAVHAIASAQATNAQTLADLRRLHDTGVLSDADYRQRVAALRSGGTTPSATRVSTPAQREGSGQQYVPGAPGGYDLHHFGSPTVPHTVNDAQWGIPWGTVKLPPNWSLNAQVVHAGTNGCTATGHGLFVVMESPDKRYALGIFPALKSQWASGPGVNIQQAVSHGCFVSPSTHAADFISRALEPKVHPNTHFEVIGVMEAPEQKLVAAQIEQMNRQVPPLQVQGMRNQQTIEPVRVFVRVNENGRNYIEGYSLTYVCTHMQMQGMRMPGMPAMQGLDTLDCNAYNMITERTPDNGTDPTKQPDDPSLKPFFAFQPNPQWQQKMNLVAQQENEAMNAQTREIGRQGMRNIEAAGARAQASHNADMQRSDQIMANYRNRQSAQDAVQQGTIDYLSNSQRVTNPSTGVTYRVDNQANHVYFDNNGHVLSTDSAYNPGVDWTAGNQVR